MNIMGERMTMDIVRVEYTLTGGGGNILTRNEDSAGHKTYRTVIPEQVANSATLTNRERDSVDRRRNGWMKGPYLAVEATEANCPIEKKASAFSHA